MGERVSNCHMGYQKWVRRVLTQSSPEFSGFVRKITLITKALIGGFLNTSGKVSWFVWKVSWFVWKVSWFVCKITCIMKALIGGILTHLHRRENCNLLWISCTVLDFLYGINVWKARTTRRHCWQSRYLCKRGTWLQQHVLLNQKPFVQKESDYI